MSKRNKGAAFSAQVPANAGVVGSFGAALLEAGIKAESDNVSEAVEVEDKVEDKVEAKSDSVLSADTVAALRDLAARAGEFESNARTTWSGFKADFVKLTADFPRLDNGALDRESAQMVAAREVFMPAMCAALAKSGRYDRALFKAGDNDYRIPTADQASNYLLTGSAIVSMDRKTLAALPSLVDYPYGLRRFVESGADTISNTATKAWGRFFEADFVEVGKKNGRGGAQSLEEWLGGLKKTMTAKVKLARKEKLTVSSDAVCNAALATFIKTVLKG